MLTVVARLLEFEYKLGIAESSKMPVEEVQSGEERVEGRGGQARREEAMSEAIEPAEASIIMTLRLPSWSMIAVG